MVKDIKKAGANSKAKSLSEKKKIKKSQQKRSKASEQRQNATKRSAKKRSRIKSKARSVKWIAISLLIALACSGWALALYWHTKIENLSSAAGERGATACFASNLEWIDAAIYKNLFIAGLSSKDIISTTSSTKKDKKASWKFTRIEISLPAKPDIREIEKAFSRSSALERIDATRRFIRSKDGSIILEIKAGNRLTHRIKFIPKRKVAKAVPEKPVPPKPPVPRKPSGRIAIIIDDIGTNLDRARELIKIDASITLSIFPMAPFSWEIAEEAHQNNKTVMLHVPMEPHNAAMSYPSDEFLKVDMSDREIIQKLMADLKSVPYIEGINNHMGSKFTENDRKMRVVLRTLKKEGLFFIDSRTTPSSKGYQLAKSIGVPTAERDIFLDNEKTLSATKDKIIELAKLASIKGSAIGIGHPHSSTIEALKEVVPELKAMGYEFVSVKELLE